MGYTDESGVTLPPLHPRCRCAIMYEEVAAPRRINPSNQRGLAAGNIDTTTTEGSPPRLIGKLEKVTPAIIKKTLEYYEAQIVKSSVEHAVIVTTAGEIWHCNGDVHGILKENFNQIRKELKGAYVTHNHPLGAEENDNTFSDDDMNHFMEFEMALLRGIDEKFLYELNREANDLDFEEMNFDDLIKLLEEKVKDSHLYIGLKAKLNGIGYRRWDR